MPTAPVAMPASRRRRSAPGTWYPAPSGIFAEAVRRETGLATGAVGFITEPRQAETLVAEGRTDVVLLARQFLRDPYFPLHAAAALHRELAWPVQYERGRLTK